MKRQIKLTAEEQVQHQASENQAGLAHEFATPEAMLRHDALHTPVPPAIGQRLQASLAQSPEPAKGWWRRLFKT
jgi:hypothetical protein